MSCGGNNKDYFIVCLVDNKFNGPSRANDFLNFMFSKVNFNSTDFLY
jgi:hypothetical protein